MSQSKPDPVEWAFLCSAVAAAVGGGGDLPPLSAQGDQELLVDLALRHRCLPLLAQACERAGPEKTGLTPATLTRVRGQRQSLAIRAIFQQARLVELLQSLTDAGLRAMPLKGPALAAVAYGDVTLRTSDDLDVWTHPDDFLRAVHHLEEAGFVPFVQLSEPEALAHRRAGWDRGFRNGGNDLTVELCTGMTPRYFGW